jgi:hypothetical protein
MYLDDANERSLQRRERLYLLRYLQLGRDLRRNADHLYEQPEFMHDAELQRDVDVCVDAPDEWDLQRRQHMYFLGYLQFLGDVRRNTDHLYDRPELVHDVELQRDVYVYVDDADERSL